MSRPHAVDDALSRLRREQRTDETPGSRTARLAAQIAGRPEPDSVYLDEETGEPPRRTSTEIAAEIRSGRHR